MCRTNLPFMSEFKPIFFDQCSGQFMGLVKGMELPLHIIPEVPPPEQIWRGVGNPWDVPCTHFKIVKGR